MEEGLRQTEVISTPAKEDISEGLDTRLRSLALLDRSRWVRRIVDLALRGIEVEPIPPYLDEEHQAILVSNYPSVAQTLRAVLKVGCRLPGEGFRLKGIGRPEVATRANFILKALGIHRLLFPVRKDENGTFTMSRKVVQKVLAYLDGPGRVLWISITGRTRGNGLLEGDLRAGTVLFALKKGVPLVPMGIVTREHKGKPRAARVRFGEPIHPPRIDEMGDFEKTDFLIDFSKLLMCSIAELLPSGQRGDFEHTDDMLAETKRRLGMN
jgi:hypothetical protein